MKMDKALGLNAPLHLLLLDVDDLNRTKEGVLQYIYVAQLRHLLSHEAKKEGGG
jgi:hypothetical protein